MTQSKPRVGEIVDCAGQEAIIVKTGRFKTGSKTNVSNIALDPEDVYLGVEAEVPDGTHQRRFQPWAGTPEMFAEWAEFERKSIWATIVRALIETCPWIHPANVQILYDHQRMVVRAPAFPQIEIQILSDVTEGEIQGTVIRVSGSGRASMFSETGRNDAADAQGVVWSVLDAVKTERKKNSLGWATPQVSVRNLTFRNFRGGDIVTLPVGSVVLRVLGATPGGAGPATFYTIAAVNQKTGDPLPAGWFHLDPKIWGSDKIHETTFMTDPKIPGGFGSEFPE